jgi:muconolactone D-isomerase
MFFMVHMNVNIPADMPQTAADQLKKTEKVYSQDLQRKGVWRELWRVVGKYENYSLFEVGDNDELHAILSSLPLFPYMTMDVIPLAHHPSRISDDEL